MLNLKTTKKATKVSSNKQWESKCFQELAIILFIKKFNKNIYFTLTFSHEITASKRTCGTIHLYYAKQNEILELTRTPIKLHNLGLYLFDTLKKPLNIAINIIPFFIFPFYY